jgi:hypothetical protein
MMRGSVVLSVLEASDGHRRPTHWPGDGNMGALVVVVVIDDPEAQDSQTPQGVSGAQVVQLSQ